MNHVGENFRVIFVKEKGISFLSPCLYNFLKHYLLKFLFVFHLLTCRHFENLFLSLSALSSHTQAAVRSI